MSKAKHDIIVFGATSFVGKILCKYLVRTYGDSLNWAAAARSRSKLDALVAELGDAGAKLPTIVANADDEASLKKLCAATRVVISTVGPYALYGEPLVKVCAETGTDYCDLTGEVQWVRLMINRYEAQAKASGARIVHCCGFDSIPSDLGVFFLQQEAIKRFGKPCNRIKMRVKALRGGASGGTVASLLNVLKEVGSDAELRRVLADPYSIVPNSNRPKPHQPNVVLAEHDPDFQGWIAPFIMAGINTRIVQRSAAQLSEIYGEQLVYDEAMLVGAGPVGAAKAVGLGAGIGVTMLAGIFKPGRWALGKVLPEPGEGPSPAEQRAGYYDMRFFGRTEDDKVLRCKVMGDQDPGYGSTAKMLGEAAACLAFDTPAAKHPGGFWTPASLMGERLIERLQKDAGLSFALV